MALPRRASLLAGCGGGDDSGRRRLSNVPDRAGLRDKVGDAASPQGRLPAVDGRTLQDVADSMTGGAGGRARDADVHDGPQPARVRRDRRRGQVRLRQDRGLPRARRPARRRGPVPAPADVLVTDPAFRSSQAATERDLFAAVYAAEVPLRKTGAWSVLVVDAVGRRARRRADPDQGRRPPGRRPRRSARRRRRSRPTRSPPPRATRSRSTRGSRRRPSCTRSPSPTSSARSRSRCCSRRRSCASRASAAR